MKVTVSVNGRFHAFDLARELHEQGALAGLITSYPGFVARRHGVPRELVTSLVGNELLSRAWRRLPRALVRNFNAQLFLNEQFESAAAKRIKPGADVFVGWSGSSLKGLRRAGSLGMLTVVERGSSHMLSQCQILEEEHALHGVPFRATHEGVVEKELREYEEADFISVPSRYVKRSFLERGVPEAKLIHVPYGVALQGFHPSRKADGVFRVVHCGAVSLRKGCHYLLRAFRELALPNSELCFVGHVAQEMEPFIRRWAGENVVFHGNQPQADLVRFYGQGSVFCLASVEEGLAMVQLQAMACGLPVLATVNTGAEDVVRDGRDGFIIPIRDVDALKEKLLFLYEHPSVGRDMGASARERVASGFTWADYGRRILQAYRGLRGRLEERVDRTAGPSLAITASEDNDR